MRWTHLIGGLAGVAGILGATLHAHALPVPALGQAAYMALFHAAPLLWLSREKRSLLSILQGVFFSGGVLLFTGSIYLKYLAGWDQATVIAPAGGTLLIGGWCLVAVSALRRRMPA
ncbi:MAG: DUF423 domain-containing protein [Bacteroidia bacterium]|nr:DUF423 domain-containing protein [Bacteroidia bacterium]